MVTPCRVPANLPTAGTVVIVFIAANQAETEISFLFRRAVTPLWLALGIAGLGGFLAGALFKRRRR